MFAERRASGEGGDSKAAAIDARHLFIEAADQRDVVVVYHAVRAPDVIGVKELSVLDERVWLVAARKHDRRGVEHPRHEVIDPLVLAGTCTAKRVRVLFYAACLGAASRAHHGRCGDAHTLAHAVAALTSALRLNSTIITSQTGSRDRKSCQ